MTSRHPLAVVSSRRDARARREVTRAVNSGPKNAHRRRGSIFFSVGALLCAGALLISVSVPAVSLVAGNSTAVASVATFDRDPGQSIEVPADAANLTPGRDGYEVLSYAQVLAQKYAAVDHTYSATSGAIRWPFPYSVQINDGFGPRSDGFHKGIDMMAPGGTPIYAIADGVATTAAFDGSGYGQHVVLQHSVGGIDVESLYAHMIAGSSPIVVGQQVKVGDFLGLVGDTGYTTAVHLHFEIHVNKVPVDPFAWLQANAV